MLRFLVYMPCAAVCSALSLAAVAAPPPSDRPALCNTAMISTRTATFDLKWQGLSSEAHKADENWVPLTGNKHIGFQSVITMSCDKSWLHRKLGISPKSVTPVFPGKTHD